MIFRYKYANEEEKNKIIDENNDKFIYGFEFLFEGNFILLSDIEEEHIPSLEEQINYRIKEASSKISILEAENEKLKVEQEQQNEEILVNMLANTEMFEMILSMMPMTLSEDKTKNSGGSNMVEVYCTLIIKNVKTIEDVPLVIREQVIERLKQLEVPVK